MTLHNSMLAIAPCWAEDLQTPHLEGWLCPSLFHFFNDTPKNLYVAAKPLA